VPPCGRRFGIRGRGDDRGLLRHCTDAEIEANYTDTHGASVVGFAFCHLLGFRLLPRLKHIGAARLYRPADGATYPALEEITTRPIRWELIAQQYAQLVKYATALRLVVPRLAWRLDCLVVEFFLMVVVCRSVMA
jgi:TnpA family transposase